ncbi:uncharacterized protein G2W53_028940 [Senna tora]|uniref:Uncharacterized protein n=1 Tax=Senna tora TaxID=362788 RepID=A0A834WD95_9FABA|nr:uncharacterized protein G2W53_028940 [Senna tora]
MRDSIPPGKKNCIVTMLDINPGKSLHIVEGNQLKQEVVSGIRSSTEFPIPSLREHSTLLPKEVLVNKINTGGSSNPRRIKDGQISPQLKRKYSSRNFASRPRDWQGIKTSEILNPTKQASRLGDWQAIEILENLNPRNQASRPGDWQAIEIPIILDPRNQASRPGYWNQASRPGDWQGIEVLLPAMSTNRLSLLLETHDCLDYRLKPYSKFIFVPTLRAILNILSALMKGHSLKSRDSNLLSFI